MSVDVSNGIFAWKLMKSQKEGWMADKQLFQSRLDCGKSIIQVLPGEAAGKFILSTRTSDHLWSIDCLQEDARTYSGMPEIGKWVQHRQPPVHVICIEGLTARNYAWTDWSEVAVVHLTNDFTGLQLRSITPYASGCRPRILLELSELDGSPETRGLHLLDAALFSNEDLSAKEAVPKTAKVRKGGDESAKITEGAAAAAAVSIPLFGPQLATLADRVAHVIGFGDTIQFVFLDTQSWVCSADLEHLGDSSVSYSRHFFVPYDWLAGTRDVICTVARRDVLFAWNEDVAIIKGGLEYPEKVNAEVQNAVIK